MATPNANNEREERKGQCRQQVRWRGVLETDAQKLAHLLVCECPTKLPDHQHKDLCQTDTADQLCESEEFIQLRWQQTILLQDLGPVEPLLRVDADLATDWDEEACPTQKSPQAGDFSLRGLICITLKLQASFSVQMAMHTMAWHSRHSSK